MAVELGSGPIGASTKFSLFGSSSTDPPLEPTTALGGVVQGGQPSPVVILLGMVALLLLLKVIGESKNTAIDPAHIHIGGYNLLGITVVSIVGIGLLKLVFNRWQVPGVTPLLNFI